MGIAMQKKPYIRCTYVKQCIINRLKVNCAHVAIFAAPVSGEWSQITTAHVSGQPVVYLLDVCICFRIKGIGHGDL